MENRRIMSEKGLGATNCATFLVPFLKLQRKKRKYSKLLMFSCDQNNEPW
jgi:hypothetical protein